MDSKNIKDDFLDNFIYISPIFKDTSYINLWNKKDLIEYRDTCLRLMPKEDIFN